MNKLQSVYSMYMLNYICGISVNIGKENFGKSLMIRQLFPPPNISRVQ